MADRDINALKCQARRGLKPAAYEAEAAIEYLVDEIATLRRNLALADAQIAQKDALLDGLREADGRRRAEVERLAHALDNAHTERVAALADGDRMRAAVIAYLAALDVDEDHALRLSKLRALVEGPALDEAIEAARAAVEGK